LLQLEQRKAEWREGVYVRIHGHLRAFGGEKSIVAFNIRPVTDFNEVGFYRFLFRLHLCHMCICTRISCLRAAPGKGRLAAGSFVCGIQRYSPVSVHLVAHAHRTTLDHMYPSIYSSGNTPCKMTDGLCASWCS